MEWISVKDRLPITLDEMFVCHKYDTIDSHEYSIAYYHLGSKVWVADTEALYAENYDGNCNITLDIKVTHWAEIEPPK